MFTDLQPLQWLIRDMYALFCLTRWRLRISELDLSIEYKKGYKNQIADTLSCMKTECKTTVEVDFDIPVLVLDNIPAQKLSRPSMQVDIIDDEDAADLTIVKSDLSNPICTYEDELLQSIQLKSL